MMLSGLAGLAGIIALLVLSLINEYQVANKHAQIEVENISRVLEEHALATVQKVDLLLLDVQRHVRPADMRLAREAGGQRAGELHALLKSHRESVPEVSLLHLINAKGEHIHSALDVLPSVILADRPYFQRQRDDPAAGLVISSPIVSRVTGNWTLILSRRINFEDGSFAGTVQASLKMEYFQQFYRTLNLGTHGLVALYDKEQRLAARYPPSEKEMGKKVSNHPVKPYIERGAKYGVYHAKSPLDGLEHQVSFRQVRDLPLIVLAGIAEDDYLAEWHRHIWQYGVGAMIFGLVVIGFGLRQRRAEEQLNAASIYARSLIEASLDPLVTISAEGTITDVNTATEKVTGIPRDKLIGSDFSEYFTEPEKARAGYQQAFSQGQVTDYPLAICHTSGIVTDVLYNASIYRDTQGNVAGVFAAARDITERKRAEMALKSLNETLEQRVQEETTKNMAQERLMIQQSRLAAMGEMIGNIAHQWRQPINALNLLLANIKDAYEFNDLTRESLDSDVKTGQELIQRMSSTIDDFRNFFKPNKEKQRFLACNEVAEAIKLVSHSFKNNNIEIIQDKNAEPCAVFGYPNEFAQVVLNVLANAKEAIASKKVAGKVRIKEEKRGNAATVIIRDNGGGIPEEIMGKLFDPYFTTKEKGTGIGLYMSKMIMDNMDGNIVIRNVEDGAEVLLTLPLAEESAA